MSNILAVAETRSGELRQVAFEGLAAARLVASAEDEVHAVLAGPTGIGEKTSLLAEHGADAVFVTEHDAFTHYNPFAHAALIANRARAGGYGTVVLSASAQGKDLAPRVAARLGVPLASDVLTLSRDASGIVVTHYVYAGKIVATFRLTASPAVISVRPGAVAAIRSPGKGRVESVPLAGDPSAARLVVTDTLRGDNRRLDLSEAPVIISGGRGLKAPENFRLVEELAEAFGNAAVGATRAVTDEGWRPHSDQIGQTGRQVSPDLYIAVGISGAIQHLAGMRTSRTIVAINKDKDAPIFKVADYGIVGDVLEILPALTRAVSEVRKKQG
jgi:electron transfer flavoprotein alpha subunit